MTESGIDLYFFSYEICEQLSTCSEVKNDHVNLDQLQKFINNLKYNLHIRNIWIYVPGWIIEESIFASCIRQLFDFQKQKTLESITIQCNVSSLPVKKIDPLYKNINLSLVVCEKPLCGVKPPSNILSRYKQNLPNFHSISLVGPSPKNCIFGIETGQKIRKSCLIQKELFFIMSNGLVYKCPLERYPSIGDFNTFFFDDNISNNECQEINISQRSFPNSPSENLCQICLSEK